MGQPDRDMSGEDSWVYGFSSAGVRVKGSIRLPCTLGESPLSVTKILEFKVLNQESSHNVLLGWPFLREMRVITSIHHLIIKFPTPNGVGSIKGSQYDSRECYRKAMRGFRKDSHNEDASDDDDRERSIEQPIEEIRVHYYVGHEDERPSELPPAMFLEDKIRIEMLEEEEPPNTIVQADFNGERLEGRFDVLQSLGLDRHKVDAALSEGTPLSSESLKEVDAPVIQGAPSKEVDAPLQGDAPSLQNDENRDLPDLDPRIPMPTEKMGPAKDIIEIPVDEKDPSKVLRIGYQLAPRLKEGLSIFLLENLDVRQKRRAVSGERAVALAVEVDRLLDVGLIRESFYPDWLANPVLVRKPNGKWRTCVDFTNLNKACPKDSFPLPRIDHLVDATTEHALLSFMDAYSRYNQIPMYGPDQEHTSFITDRGLYCYIGMPFGLINVGATYQRLVNKIFKRQIGKMMEVYVDDMLVKSKRAEDHIAYLADIFHILRKFRMKLNPQKCVFHVESGKFLRFMVNHRGIEANPEKIKALLDMKSPTSVKQVQSLTERIAALNRFVSKSSDRCKEFFKAIKRMGKDFVWTSYCEEAFLKIKEQLGNPPILAKPEEGQTLILYLAVSEYSVSAVLVKEEANHQWPVYYVSKRLLDAETRYTSMEKLVYALILAARKLRPYFQAHRIEVRTAYPLRQQGHSAGRTEPLPQGNPPTDEREEFPHLWWFLHVDKAVNNNEVGVGIVLVTPEGHHLMSVIHFKFYVTNNDAEYEALINGLKIALEVGVVNLIARNDSELVVNQVNGGFQARGPQTELYMRCAQRLLEKFGSARLESVQREENSIADALAKMGSQMDSVQLRQIPLGIQKIPSVPEVGVFQTQEILRENWMTPIHNYIQTGAFPEDKLQARCLRYQAAKYVEYDGILYKRGFNQPLLHCVHLEEGNYILREVHEGICGNHSGGGSLALKVLIQGYYWPTMKEDAFKFVRACDRCQRFANFSNAPTTSITLLASPWPFAMWGIDLIGKLPKTKGGGVKYAMVAVDYFTK
ncbi:uncharacterized protein LOC141720227 [Apium graveolens]|uniref:uncharacterized protein LOC141720227 n=1 Tax=Apium graveolens TaxID=4045 RepID=UPI003D79130A